LLLDLFNLDQIGWKSFNDQALPSKSRTVDQPQAPLPIFTPPIVLDVWAGGIDALLPKRALDVAQFLLPIAAPPQFQQTFGSGDVLPSLRRREADAVPLPFVQQAGTVTPSTVGWITFPDNPVPPVFHPQPDPAPFWNPPAQVLVTFPSGWFTYIEEKLYRSLPQIEPAEFLPQQQAPPPAVLTGWLGVSDQRLQSPFRPDQPGWVPFIPPPTPIGWLGASEQLLFRRILQVDQNLGWEPFQPPSAPTGWLGASDQPLFRRQLQADAFELVFQPTAAAGIAGMAWAGCEPGLLPPIPKSWLLGGQAWPPQFVQQVFPQVVAVYANPFIATPGPMTSIPGNPPS